jgi:hypothetical protein
MILAINGILASSSTPPTPLLLDLYPNSTAAYSLRKLTNAYGGSAIRVRRSSDNAELDIGFVANVLDTASLLSFCSATNGFVVKWYSQVGGSTYDVLQNTALKQPKIVTSGVLNVLNLLASVSFISGSFTGLCTSAGVTVQNGQFLACAVALVNTTAPANCSIVDQDDLVLANGRVAQYIYRSATVVRNLFFNTAGTFTTVNTPTITTNRQYLFKTSKVGTQLRAGLNSGANNTATYTGTPRTTLVKLGLGSITNNTAEFLDGQIQEVIMFSGDNSSNEANIVSNITTYYGIV